MVQISDLENIDELRQPRRVLRYLLLYCSAGRLSITVDGKEFHLQEGQLITITSGQFHFFSNAEDPKGYLLEFSLDYIAKTDHDLELIFQNGLFCHFGENELIPVDSGDIEPLLATIQHELTEQPYQYLISVHSRIELLLVLVNRTKVVRGDEIWKPDAVFLRFLEIVRASFEKNYSVNQYASLLATTELKLNELAKLHTGKTAQNVIYSLVISEAKRLIIYGDLSVKEVAYKLGFQDPFYFSNFFKKQTGTSPTLYKKEFAI